METLNFKFKWLDDEGSEHGMLASKGQFDGQTLALDDVRIAAAAIAEVDSRGDRLVLGTIDEEGRSQYVVVAIKQGKLDKIKDALGRVRSAAWAQARREELNAQGRGHEYREVACPHCQATIDLSGLPRTPQVSCQFCHAVATLPGGADGFTFDAESSRLLRLEKHYRLCDECGMFSVPRRFTIFYFYFLLVVYGFNYRHTWRCTGCMRADAWKMLLGNLVFILGVPVALVQLFRCYRRGGGGHLYPGLDAANLKARQGRFREAIEQYQKILAMWPVAAGVKYNVGLAFLNDGDLAGAARMFEYSLLDCSNYGPAATLLAACYEELGEKEKLAALREQWGIQEPQDEPKEAADSPGNV